MILYREFQTDMADAIMRIFEDEGWDLYLLDRAKTIRAFDRSLYRLGAFDGDQLVGFVRCTGDGEYTVNIEDCIVKAPYRRRHIASTLLKTVEETFPGVDMITLVTNADDAVDNLFYASAGFQKYSEKALAGYVKQIRH